MRDAVYSAQLLLLPTGGVRADAGDEQGVLGIYTCVSRHEGCGDCKATSNGRDVVALSIALDFVGAELLVRTPMCA